MEYLIYQTIATTYSDFYFIIFLEKGDNYDRFKTTSTRSIPK